MAELSDIEAQFVKQLAQQHQFPMSENNVSLYVGSRLVTVQAIW
jgi:hypothetical protein